MGGSFERLDKLLVDKGLSISRERAQALILAARVLVDGQRVTKAGQKVAAESRLLASLSRDIAAEIRSRLRKDPDLSR